jgi:hypothetical protein
MVQTLPLSRWQLANEHPTGMGPAAWPAIGWLSVGTHGVVRLEIAALPRGGGQRTLGHLMLQIYIELIGDFKLS